jgi:hypothetical protein
MFFFFKSIQTPLTFHRSVAISFSDKVELNLENIFYCLPPILVKRRNLKKNRWKVYTTKQVWFFARFPLFLSNKAVVKITKNSMGKECWAIKVRKKLGRKRGSSTWFKPALIRASYSPSMTMLEETAEGRGSRAAWHSLPADNLVHCNPELKRSWIKNKVFGREIKNGSCSRGWTLSRHRQHQLCIQ